MKRSLPRWVSPIALALVAILATATLMAPNTRAQTPALTASNVSGANGASMTLTLSGHTENWWLKQTAPYLTEPCTPRGTTYTHTITGLSPLFTYTYKAYSDSSCTTELDSVSFTTSFKVENTSKEAYTTVCKVGDGGKQCGVAFGTGPRTGGYTLWGLYINLDSTVGSPKGLSAAIYEWEAAHAHDHGANAEEEENLEEDPGNPHDLLFTLETLQPDAGDSLAYAYCSAASSFPCDLEADTNYYLVLSAPGSAAGAYYSWKLTSDDHQNVTPTGNGWLIANGGRVNTTGGEEDWGPIPKDTQNPGGDPTGSVTIWATAAGIQLTPSSAALTSATLTLTGHTGAWSWKAAGGSVASGTATASLSGLTAGAAYAYTAHSGSGCATANEIASATFTHTPLVASSTGSTSAALALPGHTGAWSVKRIAPTIESCVNASSGATASVSDLTAGETYAYKAYKASGCAISSAFATGSVAFTHTPLTASRDSDTAATLTLSGHTGNWWLKRTAPTAGTCTAGEADFSHALSGLTPGAYTYKAYSASGCADADEIAAAAFAHTVLTAINVLSTQATLTLSGHTGDWWFRLTSTTPAGQCTAGEADFEQDVTLLPLNDYDYTAYSDTNCTTALDSVSFTTTGFIAGNTDESVSSEVCRVGDGGKQCAIAFTTGPRAAGYTLSSVEIDSGGTVGTPTPIGFFTGPVAAIHAANGDNPADTALSTLWVLAAGGTLLNGVCFASCDLAANTTYFVVMSDSGATAGNYYQWKLTNSNDEDLKPTGNGWTIADAGRADSGGGWAAMTGTASGMSGIVEIVAGEAPSLSFTSTIADQSYTRSVAITTLTLPAATLSHGAPAITYTLTPSSLPAGLSFDAATRQISGTPSAGAASETYTYTAAPALGASATLTFDIEVRNVPSKPAVPTLTVGEAQITVTWTAPAAPADDPITDYDVSYCSQGCESESNWHWWPHNGTATTATITGLDGSLTYRVRVRAVNSAGAGEWSDVSGDPAAPADPSDPGAAKPDPVQSAATSNVTVKAIKNTSPLGVWLRVDWDWPGSGTREYQIRHRAKGAGDWIVKSRHGTGYSDTSIVTGITWETTYEVQVRARKALGWGAWLGAEVTTPDSSIVKPPNPHGADFNTHWHTGLDRAGVNSCQSWSDRHFHTHGWTDGGWGAHWHCATY